MKEIKQPESQVGVDWGLGDLFSQQFVGPFHAMQDDGFPMNPIIQVERAGDSTKVSIPDANRPGGVVVDSRGEVVARATSYTAAQTIACSLNLYPTGNTFARATGMSMSGCNHSSLQDPWKFWAVNVDVEFKPEKDGSDVWKKDTWYVQPFMEGEFRYPVPTRWPLRANKHASKKLASKSIECIFEILKRPSVQSDPRIDRLSRWLRIDWKSMRPVLINHLAIPCEPGTSIEDPLMIKLYKKEESNMS